ncbi:hypothetical protein AB4169_19910 [Vibrio lentus]|uniref:hypothetical protein n=1 Tax=Vibrio lentus TaxID=136468 RepID=UPI0024697AC7|nr:hypothetical protein [Vibrio lentus]MDH5927916.1 hypothetical protein [Vibrio lentus]
MTMICAREFSKWLRHRFNSEKTGISISREDINQLTGRQRLDPSFVNDVHYELMQYGMAFVTDTSRESFYLVPVSQAKNWREQLEYQFEKEMFCNIYPIEKSG